MRFALLVFMSLTVLVASVEAQVDADVSGSNDHPSVGRYPASNISQHTVSNYDRYVYPITTNSRDSRDEFESLTLEGRRTTIVYDVPKDGQTSLLGVFRSIESSLKERNFQLDLNCIGHDSGCGYFFVRKLVPRNQVRKLFGNFDEFVNLNDGKVYMLSARKVEEGKRTYVWVVVAQDKRSNYGQYAVDVLEEEAVHTEEMELSVDRMASAMADRGQVTLSGVNFETGSDRLTRESLSALQVIRDFIESEPDATFLVVGHTDTQGSFDGNLVLSDRRAKAVTDYLADEMGIRGERLRPVGVGYAAPAAPNTDEAGRAQNRRVELVRETR